jgi:hypothetical protein
MTPPDKRIQLLFNAQGNEREPGTVAHAWATAVQDDVNASELHFEWKRKSKSSKHTSRLTGAAMNLFCRIENNIYGSYAPPTSVSLCQ